MSSEHAEPYARYKQRGTPMVRGGGGGGGGQSPVTTTFPTPTERNASHELSWKVEVVQNTQIPKRKMQWLYSNYPSI